MLYDQKELLKLLKTPKSVTFIKKGDESERTIEKATIGSLGHVDAPEQPPVQGLICVACDEPGGYRSFYADSVIDVC